MRYSTLVLMVVMLLLSCSESDGNMFYMEGKIQGAKTDYLILAYSDINNNIIMDTLLVDQSGRFNTHGKINGAVSASIEGKTKSTSVDDPNFVEFFIEPGNIFVELVEGQFKNIMVSGSETQAENEMLHEKVKPFYANIEYVAGMIDRLKKKNNDDDIEKIDSLRDVWSNELIKIKDTRLRYASENGESFLSPYWLDRYSNELSLDSVSLIYKSFSDRLKNGFYGKRIQKNIEILDRTKTGKMAPDFPKEYMKGENKISLNKLKGKVVLLDFWADWCVPCKKSIPNIKGLYDNYHSKGLEIIGISLDRDHGKWEEAIKEQGIESWNHVFTGLRKPNLLTEYGGYAIPTYILIDKEGVIVGRYTNDIQSLEKKINEIL